LDLPPAPEPDPHGDQIALALVAEVLERPEGREVESVARRAGVTRTEFGRRFASFDECLVDTYERFIASFERAVGTAFNRHDDWRAAVRAAAFAAGDWMEASPELMEFGSAGVLRTRNEMVRVRREEVAMFCAQLIDQGRESAPDPSKVPEGASLLAVGSILNLLTQKLQEGSKVDLGEMVPEMLYLVVRVYLGEEIAREELAMDTGGLSVAVNLDPGRDLSR
jgi:AcrR family transcriptional regulator